MQEKTKPKTPTPSRENSDKVLKELRIKLEKTLESYNKQLRALHTKFLEEQALIDENHIAYLKELRKILRIENHSFLQKLIAKVLKIFRKISPWHKLQYRFNHKIYRLLENQAEIMTRYNGFIREFHSEILKYTQNVGPLINDLHSTVAREITVYPIERSDLLFTELLKQIQELQTEIEKLKRKIDGK
jgi:hypothetical protein